MAAKPKLTPEEKSNAKRVWESDTRKGFGWLIEELGLPIGQEGMRLIAKADGWVKGGNPSLEKQKTKLGKAKKPSLENKAKIQNITKPNPIEPPSQPEWEEVEEPVKKIHGNSMYMPSYDRQAYRLCLLGATDAEMAEFFGVAESTINLWKRNYITFSESIKAGKVDADARAASSLFKRATGYRYEEVKTKAVRPMSESDGDVGIQAAGDESLLVVEVVTTVKEVPPDTGAAFIWLKNRRPKDWRDKQEIEVSSKVDQALLQQLEQDMMVKLEQARERQRLVLIERGILESEGS